MKDDDGKVGTPPDSAYDNAETYRTDEEVREALGGDWFDDFSKQIAEHAKGARADAARADSAMAEIAKQTDRLVARMDAFQAKMPGGGGGIGGMSTFKEEDHPRGGNPDNPGEFSTGHGAGKAPEQPAGKEPAAAPAAPGEKPAMKRHGDPSLRPINAPGSEHRVSTAIPTAKPKKAKKGEPEPEQEVSGHERSDLEPSLEKLFSSKNLPTKKGQDTQIKKVADHIRKVYAGEKGFLREIPANATDEEVVRTMVDHLKSNILALHDAQDENYRERSKLWYDGANKIAHDMAKQYKMPPQVMAAVIATQSPQKDWDQNVEIARRICDVSITNKNKKLNGNALAGTQRRMETYAQQMDKEAKEAFDPKHKDYNPEIGEKRTKTAAMIRDLMQKFGGKSFADINADPASFLPAPKEPDVTGLTPGDARKKQEQAKNQHEKAKLAVQGIYIRFVSEGSGLHESSVPMMNPEGTPSGEMLTSKSGQDQDIQWSGFDTIGNAIAVIDDPKHITQKVGAMHKVRNFYNNIIAPNHGQDVTVDTHAIAAALLQPLASSDHEVTYGLGGSGPSSSETGLHGFYPVYYAAYQEAAKERGILPREMQSITWEAMRGLYDPEEKREKPKKVKEGEAPPPDQKKTVRQANQEIWDQYRNGELTLAAAQKAILDRGIDAPRWTDEAIAGRRAAKAAGTVAAAAKAARANKRGGAAGKAPAAT